MTKMELLKDLEGQQNTFKETQEWRNAFEAYKARTGDKEVGFRCSSCYKKVLAWLKK